MHSMTSYSQLLQEQILAKPSVPSSICRSLIYQTDWNDSPIILAKPMTYMNNSGSAVSALVSRFDIQLTDLVDHL